MRIGGANMKNSKMQIDFIFESITFYPSEIPIFYKAVKYIKSLYQGNTTEDFEKYLTYLESKFQPLFQNIREGKISSVNMVFHIYELPYVCVLIDSYLLEKNFELSSKEERYIYDILDRFELPYFKHFPKIKNLIFVLLKEKSIYLKKSSKKKKNFLMFNKKTTMRPHRCFSINTVSQILFYSLLDSNKSIHNLFLLIA